MPVVKQADKDYRGEFYFSELFLNLLEGPEFKDVETSGSFIRILYTVLKSHVNEWKKTSDKSKIDAGTLEVCEEAISDLKKTFPDLKL